MLYGLIGYNKNWGKLIIICMVIFLMTSYANHQYEFVYVTDFCARIISVLEEAKLSPMMIPFLHNKSNFGGNCCSTSVLLHRNYVKPFKKW